MKSKPHIDMHEIRRFAQQAPKPWAFNGCQMVNNSALRNDWLYRIAQGTIDQKINRRSAPPTVWCWWTPSPIVKAQRRHHVNELRKRGQRYYGR